MHSPSLAEIDTPSAALASRPDAYDAALLAEASMLGAHLDDAADLEPDLAADAAVSVFLTAKQLAEAAAQPYVRLQARAKEMLQALVETTGQLRFAVHAGEAYLPAPSARVTYDARALDALCAKDEALAAVLRPHRRETIVAPALTIRGPR